MSTIWAYAINRIQSKADEGIAPGKVFEADEDRYKRLEGLGAVRKATEDEIAAHIAEVDRANGYTAPTHVKVDHSKAEREAAEKAEREAAEREAAEKAKAGGKKGGKKTETASDDDI